MKRLVTLEVYKLRRTWLFLPILALPLISIVFGTINYVGNREVLQREWLSLWTQVYLFFGAFFYPSLLGLMVASVWASEHRHKGLNLLLTSSYRPRDFLVAKLVTSFGLALISQAVLLIAYLVTGFALGFQMHFPSYIMGYALLSMLFILPNLSLQSYLSLRSKSYAGPIVLAMLLGLAGFILSAQNVLPDLAYLFPFSKFSLAINQLENADVGFGLLEWGKFCLATTGISLFFLYLQEKYLKKIIS